MRKYLIIFMLQLIPLLASAGGNYALSLESEKDKLNNVFLLVTENKTHTPCWALQLGIKSVNKPNSVKNGVIELQAQSSKVHLTCFSDSIHLKSRINLLLLVPDYGS